MTRSIPACLPRSHTRIEYRPPAQDAFKGAIIDAIAVLLGHDEVSTTLKMYCNISTAYLREVFETLNPFNNIVLPVEQMIQKRYEILVNF